MAGSTLQRTLSSQAMTDDIIRQIKSGKLRPGDMLRSARDLATDYHISYVTVHKALQRLAKEGYCVRVGGKGTFVSSNPLISGISQVGLPAYFQANPFLAHLTEELCLQGVALGINGIVGRAERTLGFLERLVSHGVRAVIRTPGHLKTENTTEEDIWHLLKKNGLASVMINDFWTDGGPFPHVCTDEAAGITEMMEHLISLGHNRIMFVNEDSAGARFRAMEAYRNAFLRHGLPYDPDNIVSLWPSDGQNACKKMAKLMLERSTAAIVIYDLYALEIMQELKHLGVVMGKDYSLAGFDGTDEAEVSGLSTVVHPLQKLVSTAYSLLLPEKQEEAPKILLKPTCVFRSSTGSASKSL
jgi:GntR family transcriptional regulator, arabinose operon transcriptional repressor